MSETPSSMILLGTIAPSFDLPDTVSNKSSTYENLKSEKATVVMFICNHCPYVVHILDEVVILADEYRKKGISFIAISSNDVNNYPQDSPKNMSRLAEEYGFVFPYLYDSTQDIAKAYSAACTPDFFIFDKDNKLVYRGQLDNSRPGNNIPVTGKDIRNALDNILEGKSVNPIQRPSIGCNIKWK